MYTYIYIWPPRGSALGNASDLHGVAAPPVKCPEYPKISGISKNVNMRSKDGVESGVDRGSYVIILEVRRCVF
jgi:hypothetical protein